MGDEGVEQHPPRDRGPGGHLAAAIGAAVGFFTAFVIGALLSHMGGEPTFAEMFDFEHNVDLELAGLFIIANVAASLAIGVLIGIVIALRTRGYPGRWATGILAAAIAVPLGLWAIARVPHGPASLFTSHTSWLPHHS